MNVLQWVLIILLIAAVVLLMREVKGLKKTVDRRLKDVPPTVQHPPEITPQEHAQRLLEDHERRLHGSRR